MKNEIKYSVEMGDSTVGNIRRIVNSLKSFEKELIKIREIQEKKERRYVELMNEKDSENPYIVQINQCKREIEKLKCRIG